MRNFLKLCLFWKFANALLILLFNIFPHLGLADFAHFSEKCKINLPSSIQ